MCRWLCADFRGSSGRQDGDGGEGETKTSSISWGPTIIYDVDCPDAISWERVETLVPHRFGEHPAQAQPRHRHLASLYARMYANLVYRDLRRDYANFYQKPKHMYSPV